MRQLSRWAPVILVKAFIFIASSVPQADLPTVTHSDKAVHFLVYALLAALWVRALAIGRAPGVTHSRAVLAIAAATIYGITDEVHQYFVPGRMAEWSDLAADAAGAVAGTVFALLVARAWPQSTRRPA